MNFLEALELAKNGKKIRLKNWRNQNLYLFLKQDSLCYLDSRDSSCYRDSNCKLYNLNTTEYQSLDWEEYIEELKLYTFEEALKALKNGKKIKQASDSIIYSTDAYNWFGESIIFGISLDSIMANDWIILENEIKSNL